MLAHLFDAFLLDLDGVVYLEDEFRSCLITLTGTLTGTGYRRITPYPAKYL